MRILFIGDIIGKPGRDVVVAELPRLREQLSLDFVIANGENLAHGFGITRATANEIFAAGVDCITTGNHWADQKEILGYIDYDDRILRPRNYPAGTPGKGANLYQTRDGHRILVVNVMGRVYMDALDDPFAAVDAELNACPLGDAADAVVYSYQNFQRLKNKTINFTDFSPILYKDFAIGLAALTGSKKPFSIPLFVAKLLMGKEVIGFITNSYRIQQDDIISDWKPKYKNCLEGMQSILQNKTEAIHNNFRTAQSLQTSS